MSILSKTLQALKIRKKDQRNSVETILNQKKVDEFDKAKNLQQDLEANCDIRGQSFSSRKNGDFIVIGEHKIDITNLDIDVTQRVEEDVLTNESSYLFINPLKSFSNPVDIDLKKLRKDGFLTPDMPNSQLSNAFRVIKRPLLNNAMGKGASKVEHPNLIMVTSSMSEEGKSFSAVNLAISIAMEKDKRVLLIDADVNKPSHSEIFGIDVEYGLTDVLLGNIDDLSKVLHRTNIPSLTLMSAGKPIQNATESLASADMSRLLKEISSRYPDRIVIFDSPPLLLTTEASVLASHMGQIVMVVEAEKTLKHNVKKSLSLLDNEIILMLLNKMRERSDVGNYGHYGYGHTNKS